MCVDVVYKMVTRALSVLIPVNRTGHDAVFIILLTLLIPIFRMTIVFQTYLNGESQTISMR